MVFCELNFEVDFEHQLWRLALFNNHWIKRIVWVNLNVCYIYW